MSGLGIKHIKSKTKIVKLKVIFYSSDNQLFRFQIKYDTLLLYYILVSDSVFLSTDIATDIGIEFRCRYLLLVLVLLSYVID